GRVRMRYDGVLRETDPPPAGLMPKAVNRFKIMAGMDVTERRLPQDGRIQAMVNGKDIDMRVNALPVYHGQRLVVRFLVRQKVSLDLAKVGLDDEGLKKVRRICHLPSGLVIANGPVGSGKTTLLYCMLNEINEPARCILTVEDPVEYLIDGIAQVQVNPQIGLTYARAVRSMLRQAPNVIMVGELRDLEIIELCAMVAITGHLLFSTIHCDSGVEAIRRLLDVGLEPHTVNSALAAVVSIRLVRTLCGKCKRPAEPDRNIMPPQAVELLSSLPEASFHAPVGCDACGRSGFRGRTALFEILVVDDTIRGALSEPTDMAAVARAAREGGMKSLLTDGIEKAAAGLT
ncbi:hypothetical protein LCGC14_3102900, partial [marine sediment metagenome]